MPNGKPGDHPYTDIVVHGLSGEFGEGISEFVRTLSKHPEFARIRDDVATIFEQCSWYGRQAEKDQRLAEAKRRLEGLAERLNATRC